VRLGLALLAVFLVAASPAAADSILFVRDGNVWGTIVALRGRLFVRLRPDGAAIGMSLDAIGGDWIVANGPLTRGCRPTA
jgi:hypothetical protein